MRKITPEQEREIRLKATVAAATGKKGLAPFEVPPKLRKRYDKAVERAYELRGKQAKYGAETPNPP